MPNSVGGVAVHIAVTLSRTFAEIGKGRIGIGQGKFVAKALQPAGFFIHRTGIFDSGTCIRQY